MDKGKVLVVDIKNGNPDSITKTIEDEGFVSVRVSDLNRIQDLVLSERPKAVLVDQDDFGDEIWDVYKNLKDDFDTRKAALIVISSNGNETEVQVHCNANESCNRSR